MATSRTGPHRDLDPDAQAYYASAFPAVVSRKAVRQWPMEIPIGGKPADNHRTVEGYSKWLQETDMPKLLFHAEPGAIIRSEEVAWCKENLSNLVTVDIGPGHHFIQEDHPHLIRSELSKWYATL